MLKDKVKLEETRFVNELFPFKEQDETTVVFLPTSLIKSKALHQYCEGKDYITKDMLELLDYIFGKSSSIADIIGHSDDPDMQGENPKIEENWFRRPGGATIEISPTGKEDNPRDFYWIRHKYPGKKPTLHAYINFIYHEKGHYYAMQASGFVAQIKSLSFNKETRKYDEDLLKTTFDQLDSESHHCINGDDLLSTLKWKCGKTSLAKIIISLFPDLEMRKVTELCDFINSESMADKSVEEVSENIFELKGELITYFYNVKNYFYPKEGTLGNSCMRYDNTTEQIRFYANNPTNVALLSYIENKKLLARAVLWTSTTGQKYSDRIYCSSSKYGTKLAAYCKKNGYKTIHHNTSHEYGLSLSSECVVQLDTFELKHSHYPYLDSMVFIDIINKIVSPDFSYLHKYMEGTDKDYFIKCINRIGGIQNFNIEDENYYKFRSNKSTTLKYLQDSKGNKIKNHLFQYAIIRRPKLSVVERSQIVSLNANDKVDVKWCEDVLIKKYNSILPTLTMNNNPMWKCKYTIRYYDKQFVEYSTYHKFYVLRKESVYVPQIKTYVLKDIIKSSNFQAFVKLSKLRKMYGGKLVRITPEYLADIKQQVAILPFKESLMDIRKSRVYNIVGKNVLWNGVRIKGLLVPFKQLRFVKK